MTRQPNPLVAARVDSTTWYSGIGIAETLDMLIGGVKSGSWIDGTLGGVGTATEGAVWVLDPIGALVAAGFGWVVEHVQPLSDALDWLAGDPDQVAANAQTWRNVAVEQDDIADLYVRAVRGQIPDWHGPAAAAYRGQAAETFELSIGLAKASEAMSVIVGMTGSLVSLVRTLVRDLIGELVSILIARIPLWTLETAGTFGIAAPYVEAQVAALVAKWGARITRLLRALTTSLRNLVPALRRLDEVIETIAAVLRKRGLSGDKGSSTPELYTPWRWLRHSDPELEAQRVRDLGFDPAVGKHRPSESETALRVEDTLGIVLRRSDGDRADWVDEVGRTYDAVGNFPGSYFERQWPQLQHQIVRHLDKADLVPVDVAKFSPEQVEQVAKFIADNDLGPRVFIVGQ